MRQSMHGLPLVSMTSCSMACRLWTCRSYKDTVLDTLMEQDSMRYSSKLSVTWWSSSRISSSIADMTFSKPRPEWCRITSRSRTKESFHHSPDCWHQMLRSIAATSRTQLGLSLRQQHSLPTPQSSQRATRIVWTWQVIPSQCRVTHHLLSRWNMR